MSIVQNYVRNASRYVKFLMDSGASTSVIHDSFVRTNKFSTRKNTANQWSMMASSFLTLCKAEVKKSNQIDVTPHIITPFHVTSQNSNYDEIFGQNLQ